MRTPPTPNGAGKDEAPPAGSASSRPTDPELPATQEFGAAPPAPSPAAAAAGGRKFSRLGDFRLLKRLGSGGMGNVYKARQISRNRDVALKVLFRHLADQPAVLQRFHREADLMTRLEHPHLLRGYEVGEDQGWHYLAMECVEGGSLQAWLGRLGKFPIPDAVHVALACARALQYAHDRGMVHRDVKPDNLLLTARGVVKVADLGLAKALVDELSVTQTGTAAGTPLYMAPEQALDAKHVDGRSDLYSLGCVFYALLTGRPPFRGTNVVDLIQAKQRGAFPAARRFTPQVPERLELVLTRMLARAPEQRYQTAAELAEDLEGQALAGDRLSFFPARGAPPAASGG
jgi:eukaryotic-like serine/threonine-protein kinase